MYIAHSLALVRIIPHRLLYSTNIPLLQQDLFLNYRVYIAHGEDVYHVGQDVYHIGEDVYYKFLQDVSHISP